MGFFSRQKQTTSAGKLKNISLFFVLLALICLFFADIEIVTSSPWFELSKIGFGIITPDFFSTESLFTSIVNTLAFALLGTFIANVCGFFFALFFNWRVVRSFCAFIRAIHELFWALLFLQIFGLSTLTGILAIAIPFTGIFAKVYAEILEESDQTAWHLTSSRSDWLSRFLYTRLPQAFVQFKSYSLYRLECGIRSSAILGFIGLPTLGFHLETAFSQGLYSQAAALLYIFFFIIATLRFWLQIKLLPLYLIAAFLWLPDSAPVSWHLLFRFITEDIIPAPLRGTGIFDLQQFPVLLQWLWQIVRGDISEGVFNTVVLSIIALVASGVVTLILFPFVSKLFLNAPLRGVGHVSLVVFRSSPELILTFLMTLILGPSMLPAIFALSIHNGAIIAYLVGQYSNGLTMRIDANKGLKLYLFEIVPRVYRRFLAFLFYRWEVIIRETAILGILGVHTLGFYVDSAFEDLRFDRAFLLILTTALLNILVDSISRNLRRRMQLKDLSSGTATITKSTETAHN